MTKEKLTEHPVINPETKFSVGQEVKTKKGPGKIVDIKDGVYFVSHSAISEFDEKSLESV